MPGTKGGSVDSYMIEKRVFNPPQEFTKKAIVNCMQQRNEMWRKSNENPEEFWAEMAEEHISWFKKWDAVEEYSFTNDVFIRYFRGSELNGSYNCLDRHLQTQAAKVAQKDFSTDGLGDEGGEAPVGLGAVYEMVAVAEHAELRDSRAVPDLDELGGFEDAEVAAAAAVA